MTTLFRPRRVDDAALRLAVFHHAGGSATAYVPLARRLPADWDALLVDLQGRATRQAKPSPWELDDAARALARELRPWAETAPLAVFGHSLGAALAFETARVLDEQGVPVAWVGVSGRRPPGDRVPMPLLDPRVPDEELARALRRMGGFPARMDDYPEIRRRFLDLTRADLMALDGYRPDPGRPPVTAPLTAFGGTADLLAPPTALAAWARQTTGPFGLRMLRGGHFGLFADSFSHVTTILVDEIHAHMPVGTPERT